ncbi:hypothetical protein LVD15_05070 [Fulvivirga maritima]|uniref:hypothetical protein n=1 Tax=Fulvivirga maritima TaxID=2904247 RepID=UPI001F25E35A|nr:hypothetical protein [Fulvivirga maritima]UII27796.1 hypothetical protein LVD15_05070 [Fulvivirga maritima]
MELKDFIVTPIVLIVVYVLAYIIRPYVSNESTMKYFIPGLSVKIVGAIAIGMVYQFYYGGGDTFAYHTHGSRWVWKAFNDSFSTGYKMLTADGNYEGVYTYASHIWYFRDEHSYFLIKIVSLIDLITFSTYSATAVIFAALSFSGMWAMYMTFSTKYPVMNNWLALAILFVPSVFFWGSGILKDTVTLGAIAWITYSFDQLFLRRSWNIVNIVILAFCSFLILQIKVYILLCFLPALILWYFVSKIEQIQSIALKFMLAPFLLLVALGVGYFAIDKVGEQNSKYALENIATTAQVTAYDIRYGWGARQGENSGYTLGELDGSFGSMIKLFPSAVNVSLFRPYLWEVRNPLMLLSSLEAMGFLFLTLWMMWKFGVRNFFQYLFQPDVLFCITFSVVFAFAVGISSYNFGTLSRYKIPLMPFYLVGLIIIYYYSTLNKDKNLEETAETE